MSPLAVTTSVQRPRQLRRGLCDLVEGRVQGTCGSRVPKSASHILRRAVSVIARAPAEAARPTPAWAAADKSDGNAFTVREGERTYKFFFITGCFKSGTHWVENLLMLHPRVNIKGEFHFEALDRGFRDLINTQWYLSSRPRLREVADISFQQFIRRMIFMETRDRPEAVWLGDRSPRQLDEFLPGAPLIDIRRDGRDVLTSWNFHHLRSKRPENLLPEMKAASEKLIPEYAADPLRFQQPDTGFLADEWYVRHHARVWSRMVMHTLHTAPVLKARGVPVLQLQYEAMHKDIDGHRQCLYNLLDLDINEAAPISAESKTVPGFKGGAAKPFYRNGEVGEWRTMLGDKQRRWFKDEAGEALVALGYERNGNW